ncbi:MFS general substrate transporter [Meredithblackwellia eburnea MCA 4105]
MSECKEDTDVIEIGSDREAEYDEYLRLCEIFTGPAHNKLIRKIDFRVLSILTVLYLVAYIDRSNIANAVLFGLKTDLRIGNNQYNSILMAFFFTYALFDIPSVIVLKRIGTSRFLGIVMTLFGITTLCTAFTTNFASMITCSVLLGVFESGVFPGVVYTLSAWYSRYELQTRIAIFFAGASASGAFAGLLAYAIANLDGKLGYRAWRWIFGIEGTGTILFGLSAFFLVSASPEQAKWLTEDERNYLVLRLKYSNSAVPNSAKFEWKYVRQALGDWKAWFGCIIFLGQSAPSYGMSFTIPTIMKNLGYSAARAQGLSAPPYIFAALMTIFVSVIGDRWKKRSIILMGSFATGIVGLVILFTTAGKKHLTGLTFFGVFVTAAGIYSCTPPTMAWFSNNFEGQTKRAVALAIIPTIGQLGGLAGYRIYLATEAPKYPTGFGTSIAFAAVLGLGATLALRLLLQWENSKRDKVSQMEIQKMFSTEELAEMGDKSPLFRYVL